MKVIFNQSMKELTDMARFTGPRGKIVRRFGVNIFGNDKYDRLLQRRSDGPGQHGAMRTRKPSDYALQLVEKQKLRNRYGLLERQFRKVFRRAQQLPGVTGDNLLMLLESRLDNLAFRAGFGTSLSQARQLVNHGHLRVNGRRVDIPSYQLTAGDVVTVRDRQGSRELTARLLAENPRFSDSGWFSVDLTALTVTVHRLPQSDETVGPANEQLVIEYYSK